jgi:transcriptional regulator with XRE-family HTH domain
MTQPTGSKKTTERLISLMGKGKNKLTLRAFAERCDMNQSTMHNYLQGRRLDENAINKICDAFGVTADYLLGRSEMSPDAEATRKLLILINEVRANHAGMNKLLKDLGVKV